MKPFHTRAHFVARRTELARQRQMTSLIDREIAAASDDIVYNSENWVRMWIDEAQTVLSDCGQIKALRGIDEHGTLLWMVRHAERKHGYHSTESDPVAAMEDASDAWARRRAVRQDWERIETIARDMRAGRRDLTITLEDADRSPLCTVGIRAFLARIGMANLQRASGRLAGLMMKVEPQVGFVIHEAALREAAQENAPQAPRRDSGVASPV